MPALPKFIESLLFSSSGNRTAYLHVPGAGHLIHDEAPQIYREAVESFLATLAPGT